MKWQNLKYFEQQIVGESDNSIFGSIGLQNHSKMPYQGIKKVANCELFWSNHPRKIGNPRFLADNFNKYNVLQGLQPVI